MTLRQLLFHRSSVQVLETINDGFTLTKEEMTYGIIMTKCPTCQDTTRHQTISPSGKPFCPNINAITKGFASQRKIRKCLTCGTLHEF